MVSEHISVAPPPSPPNISLVSSCHSLALSLPTTWLQTRDQITRLLFLTLSELQGL